MALPAEDGRELFPDEPAAADHHDLHDKPPRLSPAGRGRFACRALFDLGHRSAGEGARNRRYALPPWAIVAGPHHYSFFPLFSGMTMSLASSGCRTTAMKRALFFVLGFLPTPCRQPVGS